MMRLADVTRMGPALAQMRGMLGMSRREAARQIAAMTGRSETSVNAQLYSWECEPGSRYHRQPDLASLVPYLLVLGLDVCLDFKIEKDGADEEAEGDDLGPHPGGEDPAGRDDPGPPAGG
jgi:hypothetical protein